MDHSLSPKEKKRRLPSSSLKIETHPQQQQKVYEDPTPSMSGLQESKLQLEINAFIRFYVATTDIITLHDLNAAICKMARISDFKLLGLGCIFENPEVQKLFYPPRSMSCIPHITSNYVTAKLFDFLTQAEGSFTKEEFMEKLASEKSVESVNHLCVKIQNFSPTAKQIIAKKRKLQFLENSDILWTKRVEFLDATTVKDNLGEFVAFFSNFTLFELTAPFMHLHGRVFMRLQSVTQHSHYRPFYVFPALFYFQKWKRWGETYKPNLPELKTLDFSNTLGQVMHYCCNYNELQIVQLAFVLNLKMPVHDANRFLEFNQLAFLISKALHKVSGFKIPLVTRILTFKQQKYTTKMIVDKIFDKFSSSRDKDDKSHHSDSEEEEDDKVNNEGEREEGEYKTYNNDNCNNDNSYNNIDHDNNFQSSSNDILTQNSILSNNNDNASKSDSDTKKTPTREDDDDDFDMNQELDD